MRKNIKGKIKLISIIVMCILLLLFILYMYYNLFMETSYSANYDTVGTVTKIEYEENNKYNLAIEYEDSKHNKVIEEISIDKSLDEYKILEIYNLEVGSEIKIDTEEGFAEGFLGRRFIYSHLMDISLYTDQEIEEAKNIVKNKFKNEFKGCELTDLWYDEDDTVSSYDEWSKQYNADEVIVLQSNFDVDSSGGNGSLNSNETYSNWKWILVRGNKDSKWMLKTWGY